jgi:hypothetical protein
MIKRHEHRVTIANLPINFSRDPSVDDLTMPSVRYHKVGKGYADAIMKTKKHNSSLYKSTDYTSGAIKIDKFGA